MKRKHHLLRKTLAFKGYTQDQMARRLGISHTAFNRRLNGLTPFSMAEAYTIIRLLNEPMEHMILLFPPEEEI